MADSESGVNTVEAVILPDVAQFFGSDVVAAMLRLIDLPFVSLNPGASFRGLHDSLVNFLGNRAPKMILALHEETAVAIAHGYAKASGRMMGTILHSNVGLMHGSMAIFNAWCDRVPMVILGATGPVDAALRRPWIDWLHTSADQGALVRDFLKWDDQPVSIEAAQEALLRAAKIARTAPCGPTYVNLDVSLQEAALPVLPPLPDVTRFQAKGEIIPSEASLANAAALLSNASRPVILMGRVGRSESMWHQRIALAEKLNAIVVCDLKTGASFPTDHRLMAAAPGIFLAPEANDLLRAADVVLALDWIDLAGTLQQAFGTLPIAAKIIHITLDHHLHRGPGKEHFALAPVDEEIACTPDVAVPLLCDQVAAVSRPSIVCAAINEPDAGSLPDSGPISLRHLAVAFNDAARGIDVCMVRLPLGWHASYRHARHPLDFLGYDGGAGIGSGPGMAIGAALALRDSDRVTVAILGDGDFMMSCSAIWTAVHYQLPLLIIVANNHSFYNDEMHQERVAIHRDRPVENKWIGQAITSPDIDTAALAASQGAIGIGPVVDTSNLRKAVREGIAAVRRGQVVVIDVSILPGYDADLSGEHQGSVDRSQR